MWLRLAFVIFLVKIFATVTKPPSAKTQANKTVFHPNGSIIGNELWLMGITVKNEVKEVSHHCLGIIIWHTRKILTTCSCLAKLNSTGYVKPYNLSQTSSYWNPAYLGWGENRGYSTSIKLSSHCSSFTTIPLPWSSDLAILVTQRFEDPRTFARQLDVDLPTAECLENDESLFEKTFSSWSPKMCTEELFWTTKQVQWREQQCSTYVTEGEYQALVLRDVQIITWHDCEHLVCNTYPELCDISFEITGILCTTRPFSFNTCLPLASPLICDQAVLGLYSMPQGSKSVCNQTFPVLMYTSLSRITTNHHRFLSRKERDKICGLYKQCHMSSGVLTIQARCIVGNAVLTMFMLWRYIACLSPSSAQ